MLTLGSGATLSLSPSGYYHPISVIVCQCGTTENYDVRGEIRGRKLLSTMRRIGQLFANYEVTE